MKCNKKTCMTIVGVVLVVACAAAASKQHQSDRGTAERPTKWDKMRKRMEEMPEDFPPRMMFDDVQTTRANTEQILAILEPADDQ